MDGLRACLVDEFQSIHVFNLRGNARTSGELRRMESGNVFGGGARTPVAITLLVKNPSKKSPATLRYHDIGDYLTREEKLEMEHMNPRSLAEWREMQEDEQFLQGRDQPARTK